ncbi:MAG: macro domain-containing protein [Clostridia bacterium]|nr:macro domain-containing protein [Clostridia bacterium]
MPLEIVRNDITKMKVDAIVNAANSALQQGGGVCGAIFAAAGAKELQAECDYIEHCDVGSAVITSGYQLPSKYIIHTVGPVWQGGCHREKELLTSCYTKSLTLAFELKLTSVAFPLISSGVFGYPKDQALQVAIASIGSFLMQHDMMVYLVVYDKAAYSLSDKLFKSIETYIDDHYVDENFIPRFGQREAELARFNKISMIDSADEMCIGEEQVSYSSVAGRSLDEVLSNLDLTFSQRLLHLIDKKGKADSEVYKKANIDRRLFSKIRSNPDYKPGKNTALALAVALELNMDETCDLLASAGFAFSHSNKFDVIVSYFIETSNWNIFEINEALFAFDQSLLGS